MSEKAWERYWSSGLKSCFPKDSTADRELNLAWESAIRKIKLPENLCVLELGCGNGFLTAIIVATLNDRSLTLNAMDYCKVDLDDIQVNNSSKLNIIDETPIEQMTFDNDSMDVLFSNFGFEYAEVTKSIQQTARVLKPGGSFIFNVHSDLSLVTNTSNNIIHALSELLKSNEINKKIFEIINLKGEGELEKNKSLIISLAKQVIDDLKFIDTSSNGGIAESGVLEDILPLIKTSSANVTVVDLEDLWTNYAFYKTRIEQQLSVGYNQQKLEAIANEFSDLGVELIVEPVFIQNKVFSYMLFGTKNQFSKNS